MFLKGNEVVSESEHDSDSDDSELSMPSLEDCSDIDEGVEYVVEGESLVARRALNLNVKVESLE